MSIPALMVCKGFIDRCPAELQQGLISLLPPRSQTTFNELPHPAQLQLTHLKWDLLDHIHFSWLSPYLRTLTESEVRLFLAVVNKEQAKNLEKSLGFENHLPTLPKISTNALRTILLTNVVQNQDLVPLAFLPKHPLNFLLAESPAILTKLIRYFGLHDLSVEIRQIISTSELKKIFSALTKKESDYLNKIMLHREPLVFQRLFLKNWDGSKEGIHKLLEERGLHRLGHVLYNASDSLIWYITHKIDMHLGNLLLKYREKPTHERSEKILKDQIDKILGVISHKEES